jgi:exportin-2 (importin alpha re-exporter)
MVRQTRHLPSPALTHRPVLCRAPLLGQLAGLFRETNAFAAAADDGTGTGATEIDLEEQAAGYQAAYSKLATAGTPTRDVIAYAGDVRLHVAREFTRLLGAEPGVKTLVGLADQSLVGPFFASLGVSA